ncbi:hypothetical protein [Lysinibacillus xylanilyticus]|uniref:hypothetical protein n=1 Tax=Lysinibacillus xylanilyticus TaxID=582475 RepID=UPI002B247251|nr:hypothetical protein [Lysinibacillus xylanilyticus]
MTVIIMVTILTPFIISTSPYTLDTAYHQVLNTFLARITMVEIYLVVLCMGHVFH